MSERCPCCGRLELGHWTKVEKLGPGFAIPSLRVLDVIASADRSEASHKHTWSVPDLALFESQATHRFTATCACGATTTRTGAEWKAPAGMEPPQQPKLREFWGRIVAGIQRWMNQPEEE